MDIAQAQQLSQVFQTLLRSRAERVQTGVERREEMLRLQGLKMDLAHSYRHQWLERSSLETVKFLGGLAQAFNDEHRDDTATVQDLMDVLTRTLALLKART